MDVLLDDYPYVEDGLLIWDALKKWNDGYLVGGAALTAASNTAGSCSAHVVCSLPDVECCTKSALMAISRQRRLLPSWP